MLQPKLKMPSPALVLVSIMSIFWMLPVPSAASLMMNTPDGNTICYG